MDPWILTPTLGLRSRDVVEDEGRLMEETAGRLGPARVLDVVLGAAVFLSEVLVVRGGVGRLLAARETPAAAEFGLVLLAVPGLVNPAVG